MTMASLARMVRDHRNGQIHLPHEEVSVLRISGNLGRTLFQNQVGDGRRIRPARRGSRITAAIAAFTEARRLLIPPKRLCLSARQEGQRSVSSRARDRIVTTDFTPSTSTYRRSHG